MGPGSLDEMQFLHKSLRFWQAELALKYSPISWKMLPLQTLCFM